MAAGLLLVLGATACTGSSTTTSDPSAASPSATTSTSSAAVAPRTVWLCRPDRMPNPCTASRASTSIRFDGSRQVHQPAASTRLPLDCFYVYPTVSPEAGRNADLRVQQAERDVA